MNPEMTQTLTHLFHKACATARVCACLMIGSLTCGAALQFNGTSSYGTVPTGSYLGGATVSDFTIEFWTKDENPAVFHTLFSKTEFWKEWAVGVDTGGKVSFFHAWPNTYYSLSTTNGVLTANKWHHIAVVGNGTQGSIYVDGVLIQQANTLRGEISFNGAVSGTAIAPMVFGFRDNTTLPDDGWFQGLLADVRIWDVALTADNIASIYVTPPATNSAGLRHWFPFKEGSGTTFRDIIGGLTGQIFDATWSSDVPQPHCTPHKATAMATLINGFVVGATILDPGCGYTNAPTVLIQGGGGTGAQAVATVNNGVVTAITVINAGAGYTNPPTIRIASPPFVPTVSISVSRVNVTQNIVLGRTYVLESSTDLKQWVPAGPQFFAETETIVTEFEVNLVGKFFRLRELQQ